MLIGLRYVCMYVCNQKLNLFMDYWHTVQSTFLITNVSVIKNIILKKVIYTYILYNIIYIIGTSCITYGMRSMHKYIVCRCFKILYTLRLLENIFFTFRVIWTISETDLRHRGTVVFSITGKLKIGFSRTGVKSLIHRRALKTHFQSSRIET